MKIRTLIVEDEAMASENLAMKLRSSFPDIEIIGSTTSVKSTVKWLKTNSVDAIFMDIELSDGLCFDIFRQVDVKARVIITTAYSFYAIKAFEDGAIDYLLKPISVKALERAISRIRIPQSTTPDFSAVEKAFTDDMQDSANNNTDRFIIHLNDKIIPVMTCDIAYIYSENKNNFLMTKNGISYVIESSLDEISEKLSPKKFFKISRNCLISLDAISCIHRMVGGKYRIETIPAPPYEITVSRGRTKGFLKWIDESGVNPHYN